jgi:hypothetical protein
MRLYLLAHVSQDNPLLPQQLQLHHGHQQCRAKFGGKEQVTAVEGPDVICGCSSEG